MRFRVVPAVVATLAIFLSACVSGSDNLGLATNENVSQAAYQTASYQPVDNATAGYPSVVAQPVEATESDVVVATIDPAYTDPIAVTQVDPLVTPDLDMEQKTASVVSTHSSTDLGTGETYVEPLPRTRKTYLLNGLASAVPFIGYGFTNLSKKIPGSRLFSYATPLEGSTVIRSSIMRDIEVAHAIDPNVEINLIGISYGVNVATSIASELDRKGIAVHYLGTVDGPMPSKVKPNVQTADNFVCTNLDCIGAPLRLKRGNNTTQLSSFKIRSSHIPLGNDENVHNRILQQIEG